MAGLDNSANGLTHPAAARLSVAALRPGVRPFPSYAFSSAASPLFALLPLRETSFILSSSVSICGFILTLVLDCALSIGHNRGRSGLRRSSLLF